MTSPQPQRGAAASSVPAAFTRSWRCTGESRTWIGGADGNIYRGVVDQGPVQGQMHALKYRRLGDDAESEVETLRAVSHPNIVKLLEVFEPYGVRRSKVLAFLEADSDLGDFLRRRKYLGSEERLSDRTRHGISVQLLSALDSSTCTTGASFTAT